MARVEDAFSRGREARSEFDLRYTVLCNVNGFFRHFHFAEGGDESWSWFEGEMRAMVDALANFSSVVDVAARDPEYDITAYQIISGLFTYRDLKIFRDFARIFEQIFDDPSGGMFKLRQQFVTPDKTLDIKAMVAEARRELDDFSAALDLYFKENVMGVDTGIRLPEVENLGRPDFVINMNFTDTAKLYGVADDEIFYTRGKAGCDPLALVLGSPDEGDGDPAWRPLKIYFRKLTHHVAPACPRQFLEIGDDAEPVRLMYFGYSFPPSDAGLLRELFSVDALSVITYIDDDDYADKILNLMSIFGKDGVISEINAGRMVFRKL